MFIQMKLCPPNESDMTLWMQDKKQCRITSYLDLYGTDLAYLREDGSKYRLKLMLDRKELTFTLDDFRTIFHLLQANDNNHASFVPPPSFSDMVPFYKQVLGFSMELKTVSNFKIPGLLQPWQTLCKIFSKCLTTRVTGMDHRPLADNANVILLYDVLRCSHYHNLQDDDIMKNIFNSGRNKNKVGMRIPPWMITEEMKLTEHYKMYAEVFGLDVPLIQSQPTESTQGTHRTTSAPRTPNPATETTELEPMSDKESPEVEIVREKDEETSKDTEEKGRREEYRGALGISSQFPHQLDHLGISLLSFMPQKSSDQLANNLHDVMMEMLPSLVKEKVTEQVKKEVPTQVRDQVPVYVAKGLIMERKTTKEETERLISKAILQERGRMQAHISSQIQNAIDNAIPSLVDASVRSYMSGHILHVHPAQVQSSSVPEQQHQLYLAMKDDPHDDAHPEGENSAKRQKTSEYEAYVSGESSSGQVNVEEPGPSTLGNQEQDDEFDFWTDSYASDDDEIPTKQVSQDIMEEISLTIDEAKLKKMADEMLRQRCTSGDEHQYHIDQMKNSSK
ncbi:hypothetical protein Tco_0052014 [Tanacetum coccineum]